MRCPSKRPCGSEKELLNFLVPGLIIQVGSFDAGFGVSSMSHMVNTLLRMTLSAELEVPVNVSCPSFVIND